MYTITCPYNYVIQYLDWLQLFIDIFEGGGGGLDRVTCMYFADSVNKPSPMTFDSRRRSELILIRKHAVPWGTEYQ